MHSFGFSVVSFQSALPRGERPTSSRWTSTGRYFNPRSREGSDDDSFVKVGVSYISIRAPARGATSCRYVSVAKLIISIRAPARGATQISFACALFDRFQSALPRGERRGDKDKHARKASFQSALPRGERLFR